MTTYRKRRKVFPVSRTNTTRNEKTQILALITLSLIKTIADYILLRKVKSMVTKIALNDGPYEISRI